MTAQEKQIVVDVLEWLTSEKSEFSIMYGNQDKRFASNDKDYTIDEILEIHKETEQKTTEEIIGKKATDYCEQYKGTDKYNVAMLAIEFGYQLFETRHNYIKKHTYSKNEVIDFLDWYKKISPILDKKYIGKSSKELLEIYKQTL
jgi:hypothetical protein